ncbi:MAG: ATP-binding cassette domain-containing protein [Pseudomonadota bacterium]
MALTPHRSVRDNVAYPLPVRSVPNAKQWAVSDQCLLLVDLVGDEDCLPKELSGGMQQRVGIARALAADPLIRLQLQHRFSDLVARLNKTTLFITHDFDEAIRIAIMKDGVIVQIGTAEEIVMNPRG